ncbi:MAG: TrkA C-terminal domain-containing protein [Eubacteriales bacterium]
MTGSFAFFLPLALVSLCAYLTADLFRSKPVYESLLELILVRPKERPSSRQGEKTLWEFAIEHTSPADGKQIKNLSWPEHFLLVAIKRGQEETIPNGDTLLTGGDYVVGLLPTDELDTINEKMSVLCKAKV